MTLFVSPRQTEPNLNGVIAAGWTYYFYEPGTSTPKTVYSDPDLTTAAGTSVTSDANGRFPATYLNGEYKVVLENALSVEEWSVDEYNGGLTAGIVSAVANVAALVALSPTSGQRVNTKGYTSAGDGGNGEYLCKTAAEASAAGDTIDEIFNHTAANGNVWILQYVGALNVKQGGAKGDYATDDTAVINAAINLVPPLETYDAGEVGGGTVYFPTGGYRYTGARSITESGVRFLGDGSKASEILCENAGTSFAYSDTSHTDVSQGRFTCEKITFRANSAAAKATGKAVSLTNVYASVWPDVEFYNFNHSLDLINCYSNEFIGLHVFTSPLGVTLDAACVGNTFNGGTMRVSPFTDLGLNTTVTGMDIEPYYDGTTCAFGTGANVHNNYFEPGSTIQAAHVTLASDSRFKNNILAWSVSARPDTFLVQVNGSRNVIEGNSTSYVDRLYWLGENSTNNEVTLDLDHTAVQSGSEQYASYPVLDLGTGNKVVYKTRDGVQTTDHGFNNKLTKVTSNKTQTNFVRTSADHSTSNLTVVSSTDIADPFGGANVYKATVTPAINGSFSYTPKSYESDGGLYWTSSIYVYFPTGTTITHIMGTTVFGIGRYLEVSGLPKDKWIRLVQVAQPVVGEDILPAFLTLSPVGGEMYFSYHTLYDGQNPGVPAGNTVFNQVSNFEMNADWAWKTPTFAASDYTATTGTCTVASGDVTEYRYKIVGTTLSINIRLDTFSLSAACAAVEIKLPEGRKSKAVSMFPITLQDTTFKVGFGTTSAGGTKITCYVDPLSATGWASGTDDKSLMVNADIELAT